MRSKRGRESGLESADAVHNIGEGTHGTVFKATHSDGTLVALKKFKARDGISTSAYREMSILQGLDDHPHVVKLLEVRTAPPLTLVFEYVTGDLSKRIRSLKKAGSHFEAFTICSLVRQLLSGLQHIHAQGIMHRDVKPANLLLSAEGLLKLADFGLARRFDAPLRPIGLDGQVVTAWYRAPEVLFGAPTHGPEVDLWSAGCILCELHTLRPLFPGKVEEGCGAQRDQMLHLLRLLGLPEQDAVQTWSLWPAISQEAATLPATDDLGAHLARACPSAAAKPNPDACRLISELLQWDPTKRISADAALAMRSYFSSAE